MHFCWKNHVNLQEHGWLVRGLETPGAPIIAPGETYRDAKDPHGAGDLYEVHALQAGDPAGVARDAPPQGFWKRFGVGKHQTAL